jgi:pimeloyl-ACP methyl ester carboxylesterase
MPLVTRNGIRIHYRVTGEGPPLVLHHGASQDLRRWFLCGYVEALRRDYRLILIDPRGNGASDKPHDPAAYVLGERVADVLKVLDELDVDVATFWGYSDGARVGFGLARQAPERVAALIVGGHHPYEYRVPEHLRMNGNDPEECVDKLLTAINADRDKLTLLGRKILLNNDFLALAAAQQDEPSLAHTLPDLRMPCLVYGGEQDVDYPAIRDGARLIPGAHFLSLPDEDHAHAFSTSHLVLPHVLEFMRSPQPELCASDVHDRSFR